MNRGDHDGLKQRSTEADLAVGSKEKPKVGSSISGSKFENMTSVLITLLYFSFAMLVLPLATYFAISSYIVKSTTVSAVGAIIMVQIILGSYIYKAWNDEKKYHEANKLKQG